MAYQEIDPGPVVERGEFKSFKAIGDKHAGVFVSVEESENTFGKMQRNYTFKNREGSFTISASFDLDRRLRKADLKPGDKVIMSYVSDLPATKAGYSPQKTFKVLLERAGAATPPPAPKAPEDDLPF